MGFGKDGKGQIITERSVITLGALANGVAIKQTAPLAISDDFRVLKSEYSMGFTGHTGGEGPLDVYLCNNDLSVASIADAIDAQGPLNKSDRDLDERAMRAVHLIGTMQIPGTTGHVIGADNQHGVIEDKHPWTYTKGVGWTLAAHNNSGSTLTTGTVIRFSAKHFGVWVG